MVKILNKMNKFIQDQTILQASNDLLHSFAMFSHYMIVLSNKSKAILYRQKSMLRHYH